jgi:hypothetical protein
MKTLKYIGAAVLGAMMLTAQGCLRDEADKIAPEKGPEAEKAKQKELVVNVRVPEMKTATRAVDETEIDMDDFYVLVFTWDEDRANRTVVGNINQTIKTLAVGNGMVQFSIPKPDLDEYEIAVYTSPNGNSGKWPEDTDFDHITAENVYNIIGFDRVSGSEDNYHLLWNTQGSYTEMVMGGTSGKIEASSDDVVNITMTRMHAKMSLTMADGASEINEILFCNFYDHGYVFSDTYSSFEPRLPEDDSAPDYAYSTTGATMPLTSTGDFYVYESPSCVDGYMGGAYLLVKAKYQGTDYWYRINFISDGNVGGTAAGDYLPIVRNYDYKITINAVNGPGLETAELASATKNTITNLDYTVFVLNEYDEGTNNIVYDGNYYIAVDKKTVVLDDGAGELYDEMFTVDSNFNDVDTPVSEAWYWTATVTEGSDWFGLLDESYEVVTSLEGDRPHYDIRVRPLSALPEETDSRTGTITITAGRMTMDVEVIQMQKGAFILKVLPEQATPNTVRIVTWNSEKILSGPEEFQIAAVWNTPDDRITVKSVPAQGPGNTPAYGFKFKTETGFDSWNNNESKTFSGGSRIINAKFDLARIPTLTDIYPFRSMLEFGSTDGFVYGEVDLMHRDLHVILENGSPNNTPTREYMRFAAGDGIVNQLYVDANTKGIGYPDPDTWPSQFNEYNESDPATFHGSMSASVYADPFSNRSSTVHKPQYDLGVTYSPEQFVDEFGTGVIEFKYVVESTPYTGAELQTDEYDIEVYPVLPVSNSYIVESNSVLAAIPSSILDDAIVAGYTGYISAGTTTIDRYIVKVLWSDRTGVVSDVSIQGSGNRAGIFVETGVEGNAVIALCYRNSSAITDDSDDDILWSWHIWVTDDKETIEDGMTGNTQWMDRNLGALLSASDGTYLTAAYYDYISTMYYQWGRKDPFAGKYYLDGTTETFITGKAYSGAMNITASVQNPMSYYTFGNWTGNGVDTWAPATGATKSVYDPCPPGWRVPTVAEMPAAGTYTSDVSTNKLDFGGGFWLPMSGFMLPDDTGYSGGVVSYYLTREGYDGTDINTFVFDPSTGVNTWTYQALYDYRMGHVRCIREGDHTATLNVSPTAWNVGVMGGTKNDFTVTATGITGALQVSDNADWLTSTIDGTTLTLVATENEALARTATVTLSGGGKTATVTVNQKGVANLAAPGVIGYIKGTNDLTLKGSKEYKENAAVKAYADAKFGGLEEETVYVAYFKFGSLVAISSDPTDDTAVNSKYIQADDILAAPSTADGYKGLTALRNEVENQITAQNAWDKIPYQSSTPNLLITDLDSGLGDPCAYYINYFGEGWKLPTGNPYNDYPAYDTSNTTWYDAGENNLPVAGRMSGRTTPDEAGMFYPAAGARTTNGQISSNLGARGGYWSSNQYYFYFENDAVSQPLSSTLSNTGYTVRCVPAPAPTIDVDPDSATFGSAVETKTFTVMTTNFTGTPTVAKVGDSSDPSAAWITTASITGSSSPYTLTVTVATNNSAADRAATITLGAGTATATVAITQDTALYVGMFGGELRATDGVWQFTRPLYIQSGEEEEDGSGGQWQTSQSASGVTTSDTDGRLSTWNLRATKFPAANMCYQKNTGTPSDANDMVWYLPAQKQLMAVWVAQESFGSNKLTKAYYWSATELNTASSWIVTFTTGVTDAFTKTDYRPVVRCVRE